MRVWVLTFRDAYKPGIYPATLDDRPAFYDRAEQPAPWVAMSEAEKDAAVAATDSAWGAYEASLPPPKADAPPPVLLQSPDGTVWVLTVDDAGTLSAKGVA